MATITAPTNKEIWDAEIAPAKTIVDGRAAARKTFEDALEAELAKELPAPPVQQPAPAPLPKQAAPVADATPDTAVDADA